MAKVLVSIPDDLLARLDALAASKDESRSGFLQRLAERELEEDERHGREEGKRLMDLIRSEFRDDEPPMDAARLIREDRESH